MGLGDGPCVFDASRLATLLDTLRRTTKKIDGARKDEALMQLFDTVHMEDLYKSIKKKRKKKYKRLNCSGLTKRWSKIDWARKLNMVDPVVEWRIYPA